MAGGLFNLELAGTGQGRAGLHGPPMLLELERRRPTFADPQAAITWSSGVKTVDQDRRRPEDADRPHLR